MRKKKKKSLYKKIKQKIREFETYDRVYYDGMLSSVILVILILILCLMIILICSL